MPTKLLPYCTGILLLVSAGSGVAQTPEPAQGEATFIVFVQGAAVGTARSSLTTSDDGWVLTGVSELGPPFELRLEGAELRYSETWAPRSLTLDLRTPQQRVEVQGTFEADGPSQMTVVTDGNTVASSPVVPADAVVLSTPAHASFESLAIKLSTLSPGDVFPAYVVPDGEATVRVEDVVEEVVETAGRRFPVRRWSLTLATAANGEAPLEVWSEGARLARLDMPSLELSVLREDLASVSTRLVTHSRPNDETVSIPADGFNIAGTLSKPEDASGRLPTIILVSGISQTDRDEVVGGIPLFGYLADHLADAGFLVLRYDKRGIGQSGGRVEAATLRSYAEDVRSIVRFLRDRHDVDRDRVVVIGHGEGGWVALIAGERERRINALVLAAVPSTPGLEFEMEKQARLLARNEMTEEARDEAIQLQRRLLKAVMEDGEWDAIPEGLRRRVDTPLYRSRLEFEPSALMEDVRQPILVVQGTRDDEIPVSHAEALSKLALERPRGRGRGSLLVTLPGLDHLFRGAEAGNRAVNRAFTRTVSDWIRTTFPADR